MNQTTLQTKVGILERMAASAGVYYSFNLTRDVIPGIVCSWWTERNTMPIN